jgi:Family of unknown function (DUF6850)
MAIKFMIKLSLKILLIIFIFYSPAYFAQQSRLDALGGLSYSIVDIDSQIDPYILGGNPAWLINSQLNTRLEILPQYKNSKGDYHRIYESDKHYNMNISFTGIKPLGRDGTFRGVASYNYQMQKDRNKILTLNPYSGDAFFYTDETKGDVRYSGPTFDLMHSIKIFDNLYFGTSINYQILDGIKKVYTFAETLYRRVSGNIGIAYKFSNNISLGLNFQIYDSQERITATDVNNRTVQTYLYRGDNYKIELRGSTQNYKLKKYANVFSAQAQIIPINNIVVGLNVKYLLHNSKSLFPWKLIIDFEDGYSSFNNFDINLQARWLQSRELTFGFTTGIKDDNSWSKNSKLNLTIWELNLSDYFIGIGITFKNKSKNLLIGLEYELHSISADSLKYIDNRFIETAASNNITRIGCEYSMSELFLFRLGYNFIFNEHDFILGGKNVSTHFFTLGARVRLSEAIDFEPRFVYSSTFLNDNNLYKNNYGIFTTLRFYNF